MSETVLDTMPALAGIYAATAGQGVRERASKLAQRSSRRSRQLPATTLRVRGHRISASSLAAYRELLGDGTPESLPSVLVHIEAFPLAMKLMATPEFPLPLWGMVHLSNEVIHHHPVPVETPLDMTAAATALVPHHAGTAVDMVVTVCDTATGVLLWEGMSRYLAKGVRLSSERVEREAREDVDPGTMTAQWRLGAGAGRRYAAVSGDYNPIHLSGLSAKALGMRGAIAHGMFLAARMLAHREPVRAGHRWGIEFQAPVTLPATVSLSYTRTPQRGFRVTGFHARAQRVHFTGWMDPLD
ncbi:MAG: MaoC/PaaZ C-terminal domain-containing protein [Micrococcus sp.]|nr:MaoC/PaaZ C-terminal domain-containing protein [Micrococcus sp.]